MTLAYETNPGTNYIASKMGETAMKELESSVREEVTKTYTEVLFDKLAEVGKGMQEAADGSGELKNGTDQLADGNQTITYNLQVLSDSALVFMDGSRELEVGLGQYRSQCGCSRGRRAAKWCKCTGQWGKRCAERQF